MPYHIYRKKGYGMDLLEEQYKKEGNILKPCPECGVLHRKRKIYNFVALTDDWRFVCMNRNCIHYLRVYE